MRDFLQLIRDARHRESPDADINIEYQAESRMAAESAKLAAALQAANRLRNRCHNGASGASYRDPRGNRGP